MASTIFMPGTLSLTGVNRSGAAHDPRTRRHGRCASPAALPATEPVALGDGPPPLVAAARPAPAGAPRRVRGLERRRRRRRRLRRPAPGRPLAAPAFAEIDAEAFYDFTTARPQVRLDDGSTGEIVWPRNRVLAPPSVPGLAATSILLDGTEPPSVADLLRPGARPSPGATTPSWCSRSARCSSDVPHTRPGADLRRGLRHRRRRPPRGRAIHLRGAHRHRRRPPRRRAATPGCPRRRCGPPCRATCHGAPSPKAALALVEKTSPTARRPRRRPPTSRSPPAAYERQVSKRRVASDEDTRRAVRQLEQRYDEMGDPTALVEEVERFLRDQADE